LVLYPWFSVRLTSIAIEMPDLKFSFGEEDLHVLSRNPLVEAGGKVRRLAEFHFVS